MIRCYVVAEGPTDVTVLSHVLAGAIPANGVKFVDAGGQSSAISLASTLLVTRSAFVALVADADATSPGRVRELQAELEDSLAAVAPRERFGVFLAAPSLEVCLFQDEKGLQSEFGRAFSAEVMVQGRYEPKETIKRLLQTRDQQYDPATQLALLQRLNLDRLRDAPVIKDLTAFVAKAVQATPA